MGDSGESAKKSKCQLRQARIDIQFVPDLPGGRAVVPAEKEGRLVWLVSEGAMTPECLAEMRDYLSHISGKGLWLQNWQGRHQTV
ncbi:hypothetical protein ACFSUJ_11960 [Streptomyces lusitanus]|uniref:Uncharacterized protein n=1 Tax=Streptomyces lusitanus TaxID=68232 RepID=A0ABU3JP42_9ACTN|nr:hypothetical protein [Streptomyces lusitanus]